MSSKNQKTKKNVSKKSKKEVRSQANAKKAQRSQEPVARRRNNYKKKTVDTPEARKAKQVVVQASNNSNAQSSRENIMVLADIEAAAIEAMPLALIARAVLFNLNKSDSPIFYAYYGFMKDIISLVSDQVSPVTARLHYLNEILMSWVPKSIPFKTGTISYAWSGTNSIGIPNAITVRSKKTYLYVPGTSQLGPWLLQDPPSIPTTDSEAFTKLAQMYTVLGNNEEPDIVFENYNGQSEYIHDVSAYIACSEYYGSGNTSYAGPSYSVENEVPFKSQILGGSTEYQSSDGRVARNFCLSSGDTTSALGLPFIPKFKLENYKSVYPIQYKFLDLDEVVYVLQKYYLNLVAQSISNKNPALTSDQTSYAFAPFLCSAQQFRIAVRQSILSYFASSAPATQFQVYSNDSNGFEAFRCGTNTMPQNIAPMKLPSLLVENLRMLMAVVLDVPTRFKNPKNKQIIIPVWGVYKNLDLVPYNCSGTMYVVTESGFSAVTATLFSSAIEETDPSIIDGTSTDSQCCDLNSPKINDIIQEWNARLGVLAGSSVPLSTLGGSAAATLLTTTRYTTYKEPGLIKMSDVPLYKRCNIEPSMIKKIKRSSVTVKKNATKIEEYEDFYVPPAFSLFTQVNTGFASMQTITESVKVLFEYFIFPSIALTDNVPPSQKAVRTHNLESSVIDYDEKTQGVFSSREAQLTSFASVLAPGIATAGTSDELVSIVKHLNESSKGGFLGDVLTGIANVVLPMIPV